MNLPDGPGGDDVRTGFLTFRWYEIRFNTSGTPIVYQQGTFSPDSNHRWMGSVAMDKAGNIAVGYSVSGSAMYPAIRYTGRQTADPLGTLQTEAPWLMVTAPKGQSQPLGRLHENERRSCGRLYILVHQRIPEEQRHLQLEHGDHAIQISLVSDAMIGRDQL